MTKDDIHSVNLDSGTFPEDLWGTLDPTLTKPLMWLRCV